ncbi:MAG: pyridoxine kinase [Alphaproteobacteria bacterium]|nr:pyridoxine kinase [Alphaproteobacteria bacterium]
MNILSLQSHVVYGHVGNSAAVFALQRLGVEVWPIHTVQFSNHTGYGAWRGRAFDSGLIQELVQGIEERGMLGTCDGVLSGYMGSAGIGAAILDAVARVKSANPRARFCCDPVIGDVGRGVFVQPGIAEFMRLHAVPAADVITPNHFELDHLTGCSTRDLPEVVSAVDALRGLGPRTVLVTSLVTNETPADAIDLVACDDGGRYRVRTPKLPISVNGAGDAIAALFFAHHLRSGSAAEALSRAASSIFGILRRTAEAGSREILLIDAQDELVNPTASFRAEPL